jgi:hypothetical protein
VRNSGTSSRRSDLRPGPSRASSRSSTWVQAIWEVDTSGPEGGGGGGPSGPCVRNAQATAFPADNVAQPECDLFCLASDGESSDNDALGYRLAGTVPADAEALRVTVAGGTTATYPLVGPRVLDTDARVFMLDLGRQDWRKLELIHGGAVVKTVTMPAINVADEECRDELGPMPMPAGGQDEQALRDAMRPYEDKLNDCLEASGALQRPGH